MPTLDTLSPRAGREDPIRDVLLYLKKRVAAGHPFNDALLIEAEAFIRRTFGGSPSYIGARDPDRKAKIAADLAAGLGKKECARKYGLTERRVQQIANGG